LLLARFCNFDDELNMIIMECHKRTIE